MLKVESYGTLSSIRRKRSTPSLPTNPGLTYMISLSLLVHTSDDWNATPRLQIVRLFVAIDEFVLNVIVH